MSQLQSKSGHLDTIYINDQPEEVEVLFEFEPTFMPTIKRLRAIEEYIAKVPELYAKREGKRIYYHLGENPDHQHSIVLMNDSQNSFDAMQTLTKAFQHQMSLLS